MVRIGTGTKIRQTTVECVKKCLTCAGSVHLKVPRTEKISAVVGHGPGIKQRFELDRLVVFLGRRSEWVSRSGQSRVTERMKLRCSTRHTTRGSTQNSMRAHLWLRRVSPIADGRWSSVKLSLS